MALSDPQSPAEIAEDLTDLEKRVLFAMSDGEQVYPMADTAADACVPYGTTRKILRYFRKVGLAHFGTLHNTDECTRRCGSGYWRTSLGNAVIKHI